VSALAPSDHIIDRHLEIEHDLRLLRELWHSFPDLRLGQLVVYFSRASDPKYLEDHALFSEIEQALTTATAGSPSQVSADGRRREKVT